MNWLYSNTHACLWWACCYVMGLKIIIYSVKGQLNKSNVNQIYNLVSYIVFVYDCIIFGKEKNTESVSSLIAF